MYRVLSLFLVLIQSNTGVCSGSWPAVGLIVTYFCIFLCRFKTALGVIGGASLGFALQLSGLWRLRNQISFYLFIFAYMNKFNTLRKTVAVELHDNMRFIFDCENMQFL